MYSPSNRSHLDLKLSGLETSLLDMASMVEKAIGYSISALKRHDHNLAQQVIDSDQLLNARRYEVENDALLLLALQQPVVSRDLRYIAAVIHIAGELERMGDYAKGLCRISDKLAAPPPTAIMVLTEQMGHIATQMLHSAMDAFIERNVEKADDVAHQDDILDEMYNKLYMQLLDLMFNDTGAVDMATMLLWAAHNLERMGDRVTNICERITFVVTGIMGDSPGRHKVAID